MGDVDRRARIQRLFADLRGALPEMERLLREAKQQSSREISGLQTVTEEIIKTLHALAPDLPISHRMSSRLAHGTGEVRTMNDAGWLDAARAVIDAFLEAKFFLESGIHCAKVAEKSAQAAPAELAVLLRFYSLS